jgi:hypothetical protein
MVERSTQQGAPTAQLLTAAGARPAAAVGANV